MKFHSMLLCRRRLECAVAVALAFAGVCAACGPDFPESYYAMPADQLLAAPEGFFAAEIARMIPAGAPPFRAVKISADNARQQTFDLDIAEVKRTLAERGAGTADRVRYDYEKARRVLEAWIDSTYALDGSRRQEPWPDMPAIALPAGLPAEFRLYFTGALAWHRGRPADAKVSWLAVLALPPDERRFRTVWATFMLGRLETDGIGSASFQERDRDAAEAHYEEARRWLRETRSLVAAGYSDPLGLAAASWGWEARAALSLRDYSTAMNLYLAQFAAGDDTALQSLRRTAGEAIQGGPRHLDALARDPVARRIVTAFLVARGGPRFEETAPNVAWAKDWAVALEHAKLGPVPDADRMAWLAYEAGYFSLAERWVALAPGESAEAKWIQAKLALRGGNLREGEQLLHDALAIPTLGEAHRARAEAELGRVCLAQDDFRGALTAALQGGHWEDAAFVAERVMTTAELKAFVDDSPLPEKITAGVRVWQPANLPGELRHLLARRLLRSGETDAAENYFPAELREKFRGYVSDVRIGFDSAHPAAERAAAFWRAAQCIHEEGQELLGTELEPDWAIWGGSFPLPASASVRRDGPGNAGGIFAPTPVELQRLQEQPAPEKRYHYRYRAADLAWWAAALLPNESDETARILAEAGGWLKARDPQGAERFYQALVIRCGNTALGQAAARAHWFPKTKTLPAPDGI